MKLISGRHALAALMAVGVVACDSGSNTTGPQVAGSISVTTETSGFMKDDGYELLVNGESVGTIGANDQLTVSELDPATYELDLGDLAANCVVESVSADVVSADTTTVSLTVVCDPGEPVAHSIRASRDRPNMDDGTIVECTFGICPSDAEWDFYAEFDTQGDPQAIIRQNTTNALEIAHIAGTTLADLTEADVASATFTTDLVDDPFDSGRVVLVKTNHGNVFALGNPVENTILLTLAFDAVLLIEGS